MEAVLVEALAVFRRVRGFLLLVLILVSVGVAIAAAGPGSAPYCVDSPLYESPHCYATAAEAAEDHGDLVSP
jgi:hypothetical protein